MNQLKESHSQAVNRNQNGVNSLPKQKSNQGIDTNNMENDKKSEIASAHITPCMQQVPRLEKNSMQIAEAKTMQNQPMLKKCHLCSQLNHTTSECSKAFIYYHATNHYALQSIIQNGFIARKGRLGKAVYMSDDPMMCIKFVYKNREKFTEPILLKIKVMVQENKIKQIDFPGDIKNITVEEFSKGNIQAVRCPYFNIGEKKIYQLALYKADYAIISWSYIKFPQPVAAPPIPVPQSIMTPSQKIPVEQPSTTLNNRQKTSAVLSIKSQNKMEYDSTETKIYQKLVQQNCQQKVPNMKQQHQSSKLTPISKRKFIKKTKNCVITKKPSKKIKNQSYFNNVLSNEANMENQIFRQQKDFIIK